MSDQVTVPETAVSGDDPEQLRTAFDRAFDDRGDITRVRRDRRGVRRSNPRSR